MYDGYLWFRQDQELVEYFYGSNTEPSADFKTRFLNACKEVKALYLRYRLSTKEPFQFDTGARSARSDDTGLLKKEVIDWITPKESGLQPALPRNSKRGRGFQHPVTAALLCPTGMDYKDPKFVHSL